MWRIESTRGRKNPPPASQADFGGAVTHPQVEGDRIVVRWTIPVQRRLDAERALARVRGWAWVMEGVDPDDPGIAFWWSARTHRIVFEARP